MRGDEHGVRALPIGAGRSFDEAGEAELRATCRRQSAVIEALVRAVGDLRSGASALKAENAELRSERRRLHRHGADARGSGGGGGTPIEEQVSLSVNAPAMARRIVAAALSGRVPAAVIERAKLTISELITNSVCHSGTPEGGYAVVRLHLTDERLRLEVEDPGHGGAVVRRHGDARTGGGFGLQVVETLSERWGSERRSGGSMRVWAELSLVPAVVDEAPQRPSGPCTEVHVVPEVRAGTWGVYLDANDAAVSQHASQTDAEAAARSQAVLHECRSIVVHDRYFRVHFTSVRD